MATEAYTVNEGEYRDFTPAADVAAGEVVHLPDGLAGVATSAITAGEKGAVQVRGIVEVLKTASMVMLVSSRLFWDASASKAHLLHGNDRDFFLGTAVATAASADTTVFVNLNEEPAYTLALKEGYASIPVSTAGWPHVYGCGNGVGFKFDLAAEAQKLDALSLRGIAPGTPGVLHALVCVNVAGDDAAFDFNVGLANGTDPTSADTITESLFCHIDGNSTNIAAESDDGTTEVAATDTTVDFAAGTPFLFQADLTDDEDIQLYINGVNVLPDSVFKLNAAVGPLKLLAHMEKTANDTPGNVTVANLGFVACDLAS